MEFLFKHIVRQPIKSLLLIVILVAFSISSAWFLRAINSVENEIIAFIENSEIIAEVQIEDPFADTMAPAGASPTNSFISRFVLNYVTRSDFALSLDSVYVLAGWGWANIVPAGPYGKFSHDNLLEIWEGIDGGEATMENLDWFIGVNCYDTFKQISFESPFAALMGQIPEFRYYEGQALDIPHVIVHEDLLLKRGISLGDVAHLSHVMRNLEHFDHKVQVIGAYSGYAENGSFQRRRPLVIMPISVLERLLGDVLTYTNIRLTVPAARLTELYEFEEASRVTLRSRNTVFRDMPTQVPLVLRIFDEDFRNTLSTLEQNLELMRMVFPIALAITAIIAFGVALLLTLQSAKNAAVMRVLGNSASRVRYTLIMEKAIIAILIVWVGAFAWIFTLMTILGAVAGAIVATNRPPLDLLQIRE